jgi:hypothetical protein
MSTVDVVMVSGTAGLLAGVIIAFIKYEYDYIPKLIAYLSKPKPTPDIVSQTEALDLMESLDGKAAEIIRLSNEQKVAVAELVDRLNAIEKKQAEMDSTDVALMEDQDGLLSRIEELETELGLSDPDDDDLDDDDFCPEGDEDDSDFDSWLDDLDEDDDWDDDDTEEEDDHQHLHQERPGVSMSDLNGAVWAKTEVVNPVFFPVGDWKPAETVTVSVGGTLPTSFPIEVSKGEWESYCQQEYGKGVEGNDSLTPNIKVSTSTGTPEGGGG